MTLRSTLLLAAAGTALLPASAAAATRHAAPDGAGTACTQAAPCSLTTAVSGATSGDDVDLGTGTYGSTASPLTTSIQPTALDVHVHGAGPGRRATIISTAVDPVAITMAGGAVSDLTIRQLSTANHRGLLLSGDTTATRVDVRVVGTGGSSACQLQGNAVLADALCVATGQYANALSASGTLSGPNAPTARNVTAVVTTPVPAGNDNFGNAISVFSVATRPTTLRLVNAVADSPNHDIRVVQDTATAGVVRSFTAADDISLAGGGYALGGAGNTAAAPTYGGDYLPAPGSAMVDAGVTEPANGLLDLQGVARSIGPATDIGAFERPLAPVADAATAEAVTQTGAGLRSRVDPRGSATTYRFEYGPTAAYGSRTPERTAATLDPARDVAETIAGLTAGTTYHARLVATNAAGTATGPDLTFATPPAPVTATPAPAVTPTPTPAPARACTVPRVKRGTTLTAARRALTRAGCRIAATRRVRSRTVRTGRVVGLSVAAGRRTTAAVAVRVSRGRR